MKREEVKTYEAAALQARAMRNLRQRLTTHLKSHGLTVMEWALLGMVGEYEKKKVSITDLARMLDVKTALTSVMIDKQVKAGMLKKGLSSTDSRLRYVHLTPKGKAQVAAIERVLQIVFRDWLKSINIKDIQTYMRVMTRMAHARA